MQKADEDSSSKPGWCLTSTGPVSTRCRVQGSTRISGRGTRRSSPSATAATIRTAPRKALPPLREPVEERAPAADSVQSPLRRVLPWHGVWHAERSPDAPRDRRTSGVVQPPVHATAVMYVYQHAKDKAAAEGFLKRAYPKLKAWHDTSPGTRPRGRGFGLHPPPLGVGHGQLSDVGSDNGAHAATRNKIPQYRRADIHFVAAGDRPLDAAYDRFAYLVKLFADHDYDETLIRDDCPFLVQDVLFNALMCQADKDLAEIARALSEDPSPFEQRAKKTAHAMNEKLWDEEPNLPGLRPCFEPTTGSLRRAELRAPLCRYTRRRAGALHG